MEDAEQYATQACDSEASVLHSIGSVNLSSFFDNPCSLTRDFAILYVQWSLTSTYILFRLHLGVFGFN